MRQYHSNRTRANPSLTQNRTMPLIYFFRKLHTHPNESSVKYTHHLLVSPKCLSDKRTLEKTIPLKTKTGKKKPTKKQTQKGATTSSHVDSFHFLPHTLIQQTNNHHLIFQHAIFIFTFSPYFSNFFEGEEIHLLNMISLVSIVFVVV